MALLIATERCGRTNLAVNDPSFNVVVGNNTRGLSVISSSNHTQSSHEREKHMKTLKTTLFLLLLLAVNKVVFAQTIDHISPKDNSILVSLSTNIILKSHEYVDPSSLSPNVFSVVGSVSGIHSGTVRLSDDSKTILFLPSTPFAAGEDVTVDVAQGMKTTDGAALPAMTIHFKTTPLSHPLPSNNLSQSENGPTISAETVGATYNSLNKTSATDSVPSDFPKVTVGTSNNPAPGNIFIANQSQNTNKAIGNYLMILNNDGSVVKYKSLPQSASLFKVEPNGEPSYNLKGNGERIVMDTSLTAVDTLQCGNGYGTDGHDGLLLPNGHAVMFSNDQEPVDMSQIVPGGSPDAIVTGLIVQELDASKNVIFQWRTWDYLPITDSYFDLTQQSVDLIHANALAIDVDGNILVSMRHLSSIVKINRQTGDVMWILGGKQNQFTFINEHAASAPTYFSYQHDVEVLANGNITIFDNGNQHSPNYSRGVEYKLDVQNKTATLVWEYRHTPDIYNSAMGSVERLPGGNTIIGWGQASGGSGVPMFTEVHPDNSTALEFFLPAGQFSYRTYNYPWVSQKPNASVSLEILLGNTYIFNNTTDTTGIKITFQSLAAVEYAAGIVTSYNYAPVNPTFKTDAPLLLANHFNIAAAGVNFYTGRVQVALRNYPAVTNPGQTIVYERWSSDSSFVPLATSYDSTTNTLTFTTSTLGDFAFGIPQTINAVYAPASISPKDSEIVNQNAAVKLVWGTRGIVQTYHLQVSTNASFTNLVVDNSGLTSTSFKMGSVGKNTTYYWRINSTNTAGTSGWSNPVSFSAAAPFIRVLSPNGGEQIHAGSTYIVRWQSNITDTLNIELMNGNNPVLVVGDSIVSGTNAVQWQVPATAQPGSNYRVMITSRSNASLSGLSTSAFTISSGVTAVNETNAIVTNYQLSQNYPNPFNPSTRIQFTVPRQSDVLLKVYDMIGREVATLVDESKPAGTYTVQFDASRLASGAYCYRLTSSGQTLTKMMMLIK